MGTCMCTCMCSCMCTCTCICCRITAEIKLPPALLSQSNQYKYQTLIITE